MIERLESQKIRVKENLEHTKYMFGDKTDIEGEELTLLEENAKGDCLCLAPGNKGLVDVDSRDVAERIKLEGVLICTIQTIS